MSSTRDDRPPPAAEPALSAELARAVDSERRVPDLERMYAAVQTDLARERGPRAWLRSRSTLVRATGAVLAVAAAAMLTAQTFVRSDIASYPPERLWSSVAAMALLMIVSLAVALRPLQRPGLPAWVPTVAITGSLLALGALYLIVPLEAAHGSVAAAMWMPALACMGIGLGLGVPIYVLLVLLDRGGARRALPMAAAAGLAANLVLHIHCPWTQPAHLMLGHFGAAVLLLVGAALWSRQRA